jgi:hypothetical protein
LTEDGKKVIQNLKTQVEQEYTTLKARGIDLTPPPFKRSFEGGQPIPEDLDYADPKPFRLNPQAKIFLDRMKFLSFKYKNILFNYEGDEELGKREENPEEIDIDMDTLDEEDEDDIEYVKKSEVQNVEEVDIDLDDFEKQLKI